ncbi:MAG: VPLPA-CTERM sorting domain-containing protein [Proteobacteria bacterium]|nr:VPLPA-CTERM sorting domain-containing protein [Pseudomonadota bacterium]
MKKFLKILISLISVFLIINATAFAALIISDGSDGAFNPVGSLVTLDLPADGIFNFTTINIPAGVTVKFNRNTSNTPVYFAATGNVNINGVIDVSATATNVIVNVPNNPKQTGGPGAYNGGVGGNGNTPVGSNGGGPGGGGGGYSAGGAGNAIPGNQATKYSTESGKGYAGPAVSYPQNLAGGSGGGGGSAIYKFGWYSGGYGGGGGGAIQISTIGNIDIVGAILANGANGGWSYATALAYAGAGGGGSGGNMELFANAITLGENALIQALGGYGGGLGTQPYSNDPAAYSSGADGGMGYVKFSANTLDLKGTIDAAVIPIPGAVWLFGSGLIGLVGFRRNHRKKNL